jgi:hypothetical protein|tara:strand:+ start:5539 stop:6183 length:645 start_codon:yes stop_codon:yes gene_type:complete
VEYIAPISSAVMALIWVIYLQLLFVQYRRSNRPYLIFHHAQNENPDALCLLVNMGERAIHIQCVQAVVTMQSGEIYELGVTQFKRVNVMEQNVQQTLRQGPLLNGGYLVLGTFRDIIENAEAAKGEAIVLEQVETLELRAAAIHAPSKHPVGARRGFKLKHDGGSCIFPKQISTEQMVNRKQQKEVINWIETELNPVNHPTDRDDQEKPKEPNP